MFDCGNIRLWKNNFALQFNNKEWGIPFQYLYVFSKTLKQNIYQNLKDMYEIISFEENTEIAHFFNSCEELISLDECEPNSLVVFDECVNEQQQQITK